MRQTRKFGFAVALTLDDHGKRSTIAAVLVGVRDARCQLFDQLILR